MQEVTLWLGGPEGPDGLRPLHLFEWIDGKPHSEPAAREAWPAQEIDGLPAGEMWERVKPKPEALKSFDHYGRALYRILSRGQVGQSWKERRAAGALRTYLCIEDSELGQLPWELLHEGQLAFAGRLQYPLIRCPKRELQKPEPIRWPLRVLVLVGAPPGAGIAAEQEMAQLKRLCRANDFAFDLEVVDARCRHLAQSSNLQALLKGSYDAFHFIGHASSVKDEQGGRRSWLHIYDKQAKDSWLWSAGEIKTALESVKARLRFAYLNTCHSAVAEEDATGTEQIESLSLAEAFQDHACAVIAMQSAIGGSRARDCAIRFYEEIAKGSPIDQALQEGRVMLGSTVERGPYLPVLTVTAPIDPILPKWTQDGNLEQSLDDCKRLKSSRSLFVDRHPDRRKVMAGLFRTDTVSENRYSAAVLHGPSEIGKTWLAWWLLQVCARQQIQTHYVEPDYGADWLEVLRCVCRGHDDKYERAMRPGLPIEPVAQFYWEIEQLANGECPPFRPMPAAYRAMIERGENTPGQSLRVSEVIGLGQAKDFDVNEMGCFRALLAKVAAAQPLLLIIDHLRKGDLSFAEGHLLTLMKGVFDPIANDRHGQVRLLLILPGADADPYPKARFSGWLSIEMSKFAGDREIIVEFLERRYPDRDMAAIAELNPVALKPREFCDFFSLMGQMLPPLEGVG
jgi:hypothetical protein